MAREEAINILKQYREKPTLINEIETVEEAVWLDEALDMAIKALEQEPKWIPVSEGLPEDDGLYLVYTEEQPFVCPFEDGEFFIDEVLAWMPLPSPYQPQERSEE
jgi:hypothetical protein